jgi:UTP-glucose-1-phosphate uridylyltransferase
VSDNQPVQVVIAAGGLGTRVHTWSRYLPKEFLPVDGQPGIIGVLEEIAQLGPAHVVIVYNPYYEVFAAWARQALSRYGKARYQRAARLRHPEPDALQDTHIEFIAQDGPYADLTSIINAADHFTKTTSTHVLYTAFADNLYRGNNPMLTLHDAPTTAPAVLVRPYQTEHAGSRGVIITRTTAAGRLMTGLIEKPGPTAAQRLERHHGTDNLFLLEGRTRLTTDFIDFARTYRGPSDTEPKLALALGIYARTKPVIVIPTNADVTDLGLPHTPTNRFGRQTA